MRVWLGTAFVLIACDLTVESRDTPSSACLGEDIGPLSSLVVANIGSGDVDDSFTVAWYLSDDAEFGPGDRLLVGGRDQEPGLAAGETAEIAINVNRIPEDAPLGEQFLLAVVDETDAVSETDEDNNVSAARIVISDCSAPSCASAENEALISDTFSVCPGSANVGQTGPAGGVTCEEVCCVQGFSGCAFRGSQADFNICEITSPGRTGSCDDVFTDSFSSQCVCEP